MSQSFIFNVLCNLQVSDWVYYILRKCHFIYYILRSYCWSHECFEILPWIGNYKHPFFFLAHLTQRIMWAFVITLRRSSVRTQLLKILSSETTWPLKTKLWWNGPLVIPFQICVRQSRPPTNMVAVTKNKKGGWNLKKYSFLKLLGQLELIFA
jgi:hypothetical protein